jgi:hypothetical protein
MPAARGQLTQGSVVWARVSDPRGHQKLRPLVILTDSSEIVLDSPVVGVAVTTSFPDPPTREYVELPWASHGHPATRLRRRSAAACRWLVRLLPSEVEDVKGYVPSKVLLLVMQRVRELASELPPDVDPSGT